MGARFTANGATTISGTVWAFGGGQAILPHATLLDGDTDRYAELLASGEGSFVDLSGVTSILGNTRTGFFGSAFYYPVSAIDGGRVDLSSLTAIPSGRILPRRRARVATSTSPRSPIWATAPSWPRPSKDASPCPWPRT
ncbi:MAG: hypothetical protein R2856_27595 [Caldilineaceae bacterium]